MIFPPSTHRVWLVLAALGTLLLGVFLGHRIQRAYPHLTVDERVWPVELSASKWLSLRRQQLLTRTVVIDLEDYCMEVPLAELGFEPDVEETLAEVRAARNVSLGRRAWAFLWGKNLPAANVTYRWKLDVTRAREALQHYAPSLHREPVNARLDLMGHERIEESPGRDLDAEATLASLGAIRHEEGEVVPVVFRKTSPLVTLHSLTNVDVSKVLATQETKFSLRGTGLGRSMNIQTASKHLDGYVLGPSETFSFNEVVGPRTEANGFTHAPEIIDDEMKDGIGGGTCQVASTLHAAALFGGLEITKRRSHRRPSAYLPLGLDATVVDGLVDLKLRNPYDVPVILHVFLPTTTTVRAEILGLESGRKVTYLTTVSEREDFLRRITYKPELLPGIIVPHQKGRQGMTVTSRLMFKETDGQVWERWYRSEYHPVPEVFWLGPGTNEASLPELPEGAVGIERRGEILIPC